MWANMIKYTAMLPYDESGVLIAKLLLRVAAAEKGAGLCLAARSND